MSERTVATPEHVVRTAVSGIRSNNGLCGINCLALAAGISSSPPFQAYSCLLYYHHQQRSIPPIGLFC